MFALDPVFLLFFSVYVCVTANVDCHYAHRCILTLIVSTLCLFDLWLGLLGHPERVVTKKLGGYKNVSLKKNLPKRIFSQVIFSLVIVENKFLRSFGHCTDMV